MRRAAVFFAAIGLSACLVLTGCSLSLIGNFYASYANAESYVAGSREVEARDISRLEIDWVVGGVFVRCEEREDIALAEETASSDEALLMRSHVEGGVLRIRFASSGARLPSDLSKRLTIALPASLALTELKVVLVSASLELQGVTSGALSLGCVSGDVAANDCALGKIDLSVVSGETRLSGCSYTSLSMDTVSGALFFAGELCGPVTVDGVSAELAFAFPAGTSFWLDFSSVGGRVQSDVFDAAAEGGTPVTVETVSGNVTFSVL